MKRTGNYAVRFFVNSVPYVWTEHSISLISEYPFAGQLEDMEGRATQPCLFSRHMFGQQKTRGPSELPYGFVELENSDGGLDHLINLSLDGRSIYLHSFFDDGIGGFYTPFTGVMEQPVCTERSVTISARGSMYHTLNAQALRLRYAGTNVLPAGIEGTAGDLKGKVKPMVLGITPNISPPRVNTVKDIYQVDGQYGLRTGWTLTVYDKRTALVAGANYVSQADMEANAPVAPAQYRVWPAGGCFRLATPALGQVTADVKNPIAPFGSIGGIQHCLPDAITGCEIHVLVRELLSREHGSYPHYPYFRSNMVASPDGGLYLDSETSVADAVNMLSSSVSAFWGSDHFQVGTSVDFLQLREPGSYTVVDYQGSVPDALSLAEDQILEIARQPSNDEDSGIPVWQVNLSWGRNWTVQSATDVSAGTPAADQAFVKQEYRTVTVSDPSVKTNLQWPNARVLNINTLINTEAAATVEANRLLALYKVRRDFFNVKIPLEVTQPDSPGQVVWLGQDVTLTHSRFGLSNGKIFRAIGVVTDYAERTITLTLWG